MKFLYIFFIIFYLKSRTSNTQINRYIFRNRLHPKQIHNSKNTIGNVYGRICKRRVPRSGAHKNKPTECFAFSCATLATRNACGDKPASRPPTTTHNHPLGHNPCRGPSEAADVVSTQAHGRFWSGPVIQPRPLVCWRIVSWKVLPSLAIRC